MNVLGIGTPYPHDPSAALYVDGRLAAAAEEERFVREKHASFYTAANAVKFCLSQARLKPDDIDIVAFPWSYDWHKSRQWRSCARLLWSYPSRAFKSILKTPKIYRETLEKLNATLQESGFEPDRTKVVFVPHHIAHAASSYFPSGFERAAIMSFDGSGEFTAGLLGVAEGNSFEIIKEWVWPDSLGAFYTAFTEYCGFERNDGEYKLMGMAPYGDAAKIDFSGVTTLTEETFQIHDGYYHAPHHERYRDGMNFSRRLVERWGPPREGDDLSEPYIHVARATQDTLEDIVLQMLETYLSDELKKHGRLCFAGGVALNVSLNRKLIEHPLVKELWVCPAAHDAGTPLGAAAYAAQRAGDRIQPLRDVYLGPEFSNEEIEAAIKAKKNVMCISVISAPFGQAPVGRSVERHRAVGAAQAGIQENGPPLSRGRQTGDDIFFANKVPDICKTAAELLARGEIVGWFQGRMEFGPRALGNRSILGNPTIRGTAERINEIIKFREKWRPFCPSLIRELAPDFILDKHDAPFMTFSFEVNPAWRSRVPEVVHVDGTARPQYVDRATNPRFHALISYFHKFTGIPIVINTSLNRRGEPMVLSPKDALDMFGGSGLQYLAIGDWLVSKKEIR